MDGAVLRMFVHTGQTLAPSNFTADKSLVGGGDPCITGTSQPGVSDGYWIMLTPLSPGTTSIDSAGKRYSLDLSSFQTEVNLYPNASQLADGIWGETEFRVRNRSLYKSRGLRLNLNRGVLVKWI